MRFEIDRTALSEVTITVRHTEDPGILHLRIKNPDAQIAAWSSQLTYTEARALAAGIHALIEGKPEV